MSTGTPAGRAARTAEELHSAAIHLLRALRKSDVATGIGPARLSALSVLVFGGPRTLGELAAAEQVRPATMTHIVTGLEQTGLARRHRDRTDARVVRVRATPMGRRVLERARRRRIRTLVARLTALSPSDQAHLARAATVLKRIF